MFRSFRPTVVVARMLVALVTFVCCTPLRAELKKDWDPKHTWVFVVGLLEWQHAEFWPSFPDCVKDRRDEQLVSYFRKAGVPDDQITYLQDAEAKKQEIQKEFVELLDETDEGDLLIFYFCGHGYRHADTGETWFACYDAGAKDSSAWNVRSIFNTIEKHFSGKRALLMADCCHSGALYDEVYKRRSAEIVYAAITSSYSHNSSTGNWTFSDSVLAGLRGHALVDENHDGVIELSEVARYAELDMAFIEGQRSMFISADKFPRQAKLAAAARGSDVPLIGARMEAWSKDKWYKVKVIGVEGNQTKVHYIGWDSSYDEWLAPDYIRQYKPAEFAAGAKIDAYSSQDGKWYPATIVQAWYGLHLIHYDNYDATWDEWLGPGSVRARK